MAVRDEKLERARQVARRKMDFLRHAIIYLVVMAVLAIINNVAGGGYQWWLWPALGWGIGVVAHFLSAFLYAGGNLEKRLIQKELEKFDDEK
jgi:sterol desaturase/sphingolipid hydroxylase (fatty acid hydroxylase superfamily)